MFRDLAARGVRRDVLGNERFEAELRFDPSQAARAEVRDGGIWGTLVGDQRRVSRLVVDGERARVEEQREQRPETREDVAHADGQLLRASGQRSRGIGEQEVDEHRGPERADREPDPATRLVSLDWDTLRRLSPAPGAAGMSRDLRRRGWAFVGPTTAYSFMQAMGLVNDHLAACDIREQVETDRARFRRTGNAD